jgi:hypothetical protein
MSWCFSHGSTGGARPWGECTTTDERAAFSRSVRTLMLRRCLGSLESALAGPGRGWVCGPGREALGVAVASEDEALARTRIVECMPTMPSEGGRRSRWLGSSGGGCRLPKPSW